MGFRLNVGDLRAHHDRFLVAHSDMAAGVLYDAGLVAVAEVALHPGFKPRTGKLQDAVKTRVVRLSSGKVLRITDNKPYARAIEEGSCPHKIVPKRGKFLRFLSSNGQVLFRRSVNHPGNKPYWFLKNASRIAGASAERQLLFGMSRVARNFGR